MKRLLILVILWPLLALGQVTNIATGNWTNSATWAGSIVPTNTTAEAVVTGYVVTVSSSINPSNVWLTGGQITRSAGSPLFKGTLTVSGGTLNLGGGGWYVAGIGTANGDPAARFVITGGVVTNGSIGVQSYTGSTTVDFSALANSPYLFNVRLETQASGTGARNIIVTNATNSGIINTEFTGPAAHSVLISNCTLRSTSWRFGGNSTNTLVVDSTLTLQGALYNIGGASTTSSVIRSTLLFVGSGASMPISPRYAYDSIFAATNQTASTGILLNGLISYSNNTVRIENAASTAVYTPTDVGVSYIDIRSGGTYRAFGPINANAIDTAGTLQTSGFQLTATTITNAGTIVASNSTIVVDRSFHNTGVFSQMTSAVHFNVSTNTATSNLTNYNNVVCTRAGKTVNLTNAAITIAGVLTFTGSPGLPVVLDGNGATLTLSTGSVNPFTAARNLNIQGAIATFSDGNHDRASGRINLLPVGDNP